MGHRLFVPAIGLAWILASPSLSGCCHQKQGIALKTSSGVETSEFRFHDSLHFEAGRLAPRTGYQVQVLRENGAVVAASTLSTDGQGRIPEAVLWYDIGVKPCGKELAADAAMFARSEIADLPQAGPYLVRILKGGKLVREARFRVEARSRPRVYAADARGCPKTGFLIGEEDVWVVGRDMPKGSLVRAWAVADDWHWKDGAPLIDATRQHPGDTPPLFELGAAEADFERLLWAKGRTSVGSYDIVAEVVTYPFGKYRAEPRAEARDLLSNLSYAGFVVQRRPGAGQPIEQEAAGIRQSKLVFRNAFLTTESVYVGVDPYLHPSYVGKSANVHVVPHRTDAEWTVDHTLHDITGTVEQVTIQPGGCANCYSVLAWAAPLIPGKYDVVLDFDVDGAYTPGVDLIDSLDPVGFHVSEVRVDSISFDFPGSGATTIHDEVAGADVASPEFAVTSATVKPAAWAVAGTHSVKVRFKAVPTVTSARVWAEGGIGGLASAAGPVTVTFSGGVGEATLHAISPPNYVAQHRFDWDWRYREANGAPSAPVEMGLTGKHVLFTLLAPPQAPQAVPWLGVLEVAADLAYGRSTAAEAVRDIWRDFYGSSGGQYDVVSGAPRYTSSGSGSSFNLTLWLANHRLAAVGTVNCYDMGKAVAVFANALGANTEYVFVSPFGILNCLKPIGRGWANNPFYDSPGCPGGAVVPGDSYRCGFGNHGFTRLAADKIYDGSGGQVDIDLLPDTCAATQPLELSGYDSWPNAYRGKVIDSNPPSSPGSPVHYDFGVY